MFRNFELTSQHKLLLVSFALLLLAYFILSRKTITPTATVETGPVYADTLIPKDHVLMPIELANIESLAALIDGYGVIDLYGGSTDQSEARQIAARIKILRAPLNPRQYALLMPAAMAKEVMKFKPPFWGVLQNRLQQEKPQLIAQVHPPSPSLTMAPVSDAVKTIPPPHKVQTVQIEYYKGD